MLSVDPPPMLFLIPLAIGFTGLIFTIIAEYMPAKTQSGALEAAKWLAFKKYLENLNKYDDVESAKTHFDEYLPYAVAFNVDKHWIKNFSKLSDMPVPTWYYPTYMGPRWSRGYTP